MVLDALSYVYMYMLFARNGNGEAVMIITLNAIQTCYLVFFVVVVFFVDVFFLVEVLFLAEEVLVVVVVTGL